MNFFKKTFLVLFIFLLLPTVAFGEENESDEEVEQIRIPIILVPNESGEFQTNAKKDVVKGYLDFWSTGKGDEVIAHWKVTITTPKVYITSVNLDVLWSEGGLDRTTSFKYKTYNTPTYVSNDAENIYYIDGRHSATILGSVMTTKGVAYTVKPGTIYFSTKS